MEFFPLLSSMTTISQIISAKGEHRHKILGLQTQIQIMKEKRLLPVQIISLVSQVTKGLMLNFKFSLQAYS